MRTPPLAALAPAGLAGLAAALACGGGAAGGASAGRPAPAAAAPVPAARLVPRVAKVPGTDLRFLDGGASGGAGGGAPVVFVHGSLATLDSWRPQFDAFATRVRVVAYSRRYHPPNAARPDQAYALSLHADDLIGLIEALRVERVHLVGSSYGAYVALLVALRRPDLVRSLVLEEPLLLPWLARTPEGDSLRRAFEAGVEQPARRAFARGDSVEAVRRLFDGTSGRPGRYDALPDAARAELLRLAFEARLELRADPDLYMPMLSCAQVGGIRNPVLLVVGEHSPRLFHLVTEELARCLAAEEVDTVPGAGHEPHADNPRSYNAAVLQFLMRN